MARYIDADKMEYDVLHLDVDVAEHKCKDYESYINGANQFRHQVKVELRHTPTADVVEVKHGEWIDLNITEWQCSECNYRVERWNNTPYCPHCGAKMDGGDSQ